MAAVLPEPHLKVLDELHPVPTPGEDEEVIDLHAPETPAAPAEPVAAAKPAAPAAPAPAEEDDLPADLRGKSPKELAKMYREAQSVIGRQGSELGEYRKRFDRVLEASFARQQAPVAPAAPAAPAAPVEIDESEFFRQPRETISKAIENHPIIQEIKRTLGQSAADSQTQRAVANAEKFHTAHPDAGDIMADPDFQRWVGASRVRTALLSRADKQFDFDAGDEVFGTWKALKGKAAPVAPVAPAAPAADDVSAAARTLAAAKRKTQADAASVPTGGNGTPAKGAKKIYRRADVLKLMELDPDRYEQLAPEIEQAYKDGRVR